MPFAKVRRAVGRLWRRIVGQNQKKPSLRDLSKNVILDEHLPDIIHELDNQSDRGVALIAAALVDSCLRETLCTRLVAMDDFNEIMFEKEGAPLSSFFARTKIARAVGVIGPIMEAHMDAVRRIRNQFAHSAYRIDFTHPLISREVDKLLPDDNPTWKPEFTTQRRRYVGTCVLMIQALEDRKTTHLQDKIDVWLP